MLLQFNLLCSLGTAMLDAGYRILCACFMGRVGQDIVDGSILNSISVLDNHGQHVSSAFQILLPDFVMMAPEALGFSPVTPTSLNKKYQ